MDNKLRDLFLKYWGQLQSFIRSNRFLLIFIFLYLCFRSFWEDIIREKIVEPFFDEFHGSVVIDVIFYITIIYCLCIYISTVIRPSNDRKNQKSLLDVTIFCFWLYYTRFSDKFSFVELTTLSNILYVDIIPVFVICKHLPQLLFNIFDLFLSDSLIIGQSMGFLRDVPISDVNEDLLDRDEIAENEIDHILETETNYNSFAYGIDAPWGAGKTSFMNLMRKHIANKYRNQCVVMDFNPWIYVHEKNLIVLFFDELSKHLQKYSSELSDNIIDYSKALSSVATLSTEAKILSDIFNDQNKRNTTLEDKINRINKLISQIEKKIVIFIDDIDRLDSNELMEMLKLIRNISDFPNMYFIVAYHKSYMMSILKQKMNNMENDFIEKIFQTEFHLPPCSIDNLKEPFKLLRNRMIDDYDKNALDDCISVNQYSIFSIGLIASLREAKRIANLFYSYYSSLVGSSIANARISVRDVLFLVILKEKYYYVYQLLENNRDSFLEQYNDGYLVLQKSNNESNKYKIIDYVKEHQIVFYSEDYDHIMKILEVLFPPSDSPIIEHGYGINVKDLINIYFNFSLYDITKKQFYKILKKEVQEIKKEFSTWSIEYPVSLFARLQEYKPVLQKHDERQKLIQGVTYLLSMPRVMNLSFYEFATNFFSRIIFSQEDKDLLVNQIASIDYQHSLWYLNSFIGDNGRWNNPLSQTEVDSIRIKSFKECVYQNQASFRDEVVRCFEWATVREVDGEKIIKPINEIVSEMKAYAEKDMVQFIRHSIDVQENSEDVKRYIIWPHCSILWGSLEDFCSNIEQTEDKDPAITELKDFINVYKKNNYKPVPFSFKRIYPRE